MAASRITEGVSRDDASGTARPSLFFAKTSAAESSGSMSAPSPFFTTVTSDTGIKPMKPFALRMACTTKAADRLPGSLSSTGSFLTAARLAGSPSAPNSSLSGNSSNNDDGGGGHFFALDSPCTCVCLALCALN